MKRIRRQILVLTVVFSALAALAPLGLRHAEAATDLFAYPCSSGQAVGDFDNNGRPDLAVGAPGDDLEDAEGTKAAVDGGSVSVSYSTGEGNDPAFTPSAGTRKFFSQDAAGIAGNADADDRFGYSLAAGNFDNLGGDDLAVGVPGEDGVGAVHILYSVAGTGLTAAVPHADTKTVLTQDTGGVEGSSELDDLFGYALASADLNNDGFDDLVIGVPREDVSGKKDAGIVQVIYGSAKGLTPHGGNDGGEKADQLFQQGPGLAKNPEIGRAEAGDLFGASITTGQFNDHSAIDIAVGAPGEDVRQVPDGGAVRVLYSRGTSGPSTVDADFFHQASKGVEGSPEAGDRVGCALSGGDYDEDGDDDLAIGAPGESIGTLDEAGAVHVIYNSGKATGLTTDVDTTPPAGESWTADQVWSEAGAGGDNGATDRFGGSLATGDFDDDGADDLGIGLPTNTLFGHKDAGGVRVLSGADGVGLVGLNPSAFAQSPHQLPSNCLLYGIISDVNPPLPIPECLLLGDIAGSHDYSPLLLIEEEGDRFGSSLAAADFNGDGEDDLAIGSPGEDLGLFINWLTEEEATVPDELLEQLGVPISLSLDEADDAGAVNIVYGEAGVGFPTGTTPPARQDLLYREGNSPAGPLRDVLHTLLGDVLLADNQVHPTAADAGANNALEGDGFGNSQS